MPALNSFPWIAVVLGLVAALANVFGGWAVARGGWQPVVLRYFVALAAGFMLGAAFIEMFPESYDLLGPTAAWWMLGGYLLCHFFEHTLSGHFHFGEETHHEEMRHEHRASTVLFGLMIHAFIAVDQWTGSLTRRRANSGKGLAFVAGLARSNAYAMAKKLAVGR